MKRGGGATEPDTFCHRWLEDINLGGVRDSPRIHLGLTTSAARVLYMQRGAEERDGTAAAVLPKAQSDDLNDKANGKKYTDGHSIRAGCNFGSQKKKDRKGWLIEMD